MSSSYRLESDIAVYDSADIIVVGGGPSGIAAAIAASRLRKKVILVEKSGQLGGMATLGNVAIFMSVGNITGIYKEIMNEFCPEKLENADPNKFYPLINPFLFRYYLTQKLAREKVIVFFHTDFVAAVKKNQAVTAVIINTREGLRALEGKIFIDCTGDARVAIEAGAPYTTGRPADGLTQPMTLMFTMQDTGQPVQQFLPIGCYYYEKESELPQGRHLFWEQKDSRTLLVNMTRVKGNGAKIEDINSAEDEALRQVFSVAHYLQRHGYPNYILSHVAGQTGVRQTNQIVGLYTLTENDLIAARWFHDVVAQTNYAIDIHSPTGKKECAIRRVGLYDIPYRCLLPKDLEAILVAGRAISADHVAMSSLRVMPTCLALGQAAGLAATIALDDHCLLKDIPIPKLHARLYAQDVEFQKK